MFEDADLIHRYTRADAIRDGVLIDVSAVAQQAGIRYPVALTAAVWAECVAVPPGVECQDEAGRLWDVLPMLRFAAGGESDALLGEIADFLAGTGQPAEPDRVLATILLAHASGGATANRGHLPAALVSWWVPRAAKAIPDPVSRSLTVRETRISAGAASAATLVAMSTDAPAILSPARSISPV